MHRGHRVLAIDMDPQGQLGKVLGLEVRRPRRTAIELLVNGILGDPPPLPANDASPRETALPVVGTRIANLDVIVANKSLALFPTWTEATAGSRSKATPGAERALTEDPAATSTPSEPRPPGTEADDPTERLSRTLDASPELSQYDFVLFDAPPSFGPLTLNILRACDEVVVPVPLTYLALDGCAEMMRTLEMVRNQYLRPDGRPLRLTMVIPTFYRRTRLANEILAQLQKRFAKELSQTTVGYHVKIDEAQSRGLSIFEYAPKDRSAAAMAALAEELELRGAVR